MKNFSDYIIYVDESGDHGIKNIDPHYPIFALAFCIFHKNHYVHSIVPSFQSFKFKYWGHDAIVLHEHEIRKNRSQGYEILTNSETRHAFLNDLNEIIADSQFNIIASVIKKNTLVDFSRKKNSYQLSMAFCMEQLTDWLCDQGENEKSVHIIREYSEKESVIPPV